MSSIFDFALKSIFRFGYKNLAIGAIFCFLVFLLSSVIFINGSLNHSLNIAAKNAPQIVLNKQIGGRYLFLNENELEWLWEMNGVSFVKGRVWGQYKFKKTYVALLGIDDNEPNIAKIVKKIPNTNNDLPTVYISKNMYEFLNIYKSQDNIVLFQSPFKSIKAKIGGIYKSGSELFDNDVILMPNDSVRDILGIKSGDFTDAVLEVENPNEVPFVIAKLSEMNPQFKATTKNEVIKDFKLLYHYKNGWFLVLFLVSFATFGIIFYDKASGLRSEERKEIGILKAIGWEIRHIIYLKLFESMIICMSAFLLGIMLSILYVYFLNAPILKYAFTGYSYLKQDFNLVFIFNIKEFALLFFCTVPMYIGVSIIPAWKVATLDLAKVLK